MYNTGFSKRMFTLSERGNLIQKVDLPHDQSRLGILIIFTAIVGDTYITLELHRLLVGCGAGIVEMNVLRKHLSAVKGGRLARRANPARQITLYVSDVRAGVPSAVASGPTMPDESFADQCYAIAELWMLLEQFPASIRRLFVDRALEQTPKAGDTTFRDCSWHCLLSSEDALDAVEEQIRRDHGREVIVERDTSCDEWPLEQAAQHLLGRLEGLRATHPGRRVMLLSAGELSSPVTGAGTGGRNQAFVLHCAGLLAGRPMAVLSAGTDGIDGNSPAAGGINSCK